LKHPDQGLAAGLALAFFGAIAGICVFSRAGRA